ncbi:glycoside hydrolase [Parabacteroides sp. OttesenSCG-928-N08]|nr:glycoside hydrolase [Parabacteroides sp. OttesenSCG-928-N08]
MTYRLLSSFLRLFVIAPLLLLLLFAGCRQEMPVTSSIHIEVNSLAVPVNPTLYGLTIEEINHALDGGLYAELIRNRSFEEGALPLNCYFSAARNAMVTPNGWTIPFPHPNTIPGWTTLSPYSYMAIDQSDPLHLYNRRSLAVSLTPDEQGHAAIAALGYNGIPLQKGATYRLSLYLKGLYQSAKPLQIALVDSLTLNPLSDVHSLSPIYGWKHYTHTFTALEDSERAMLTFSASQAVAFQLDVVSLFPEATWQERPNGQRRDLMEAISALQPRFIRFPGGTFIEGYTAGTYPIWKESIGAIDQRRQLWNIWGYGSTNGMGYHEFLQMCDDLQAEPVYVINSGVTSQSRRPRYENIVLMNRLIEEALEAIAYANEPADSTFGALRAANGHPEPFNLKFIEIGSENYGHEYTRRFNLLRQGIQKVYPDITLISSSMLPRRHRTDWVDEHYYADERFYISNHNRFNPDNYSRRAPSVFIGEFGNNSPASQGTLGAAIAEACFLIGAEHYPSTVKRLAYAPVLGNARYPQQRDPMILFDQHRLLLTPSYHNWALFANNRGDELLQMSVDTYEKPQVSNGCASIELFDNSYEITDVSLDGLPVTQGEVKSGRWTIQNGDLIPAANLWNYILLGDSTNYNYEFAATLKRTKGSGGIQLRLRDKGITGEQADYYCFTIGADGISECYHQVGSVKDQLTEVVDFAFESRREYRLRLVCNDELLQCYVDGQLLHEVRLNPLPSIVSVATLDRATNTILLKVVNTTRHVELTDLNINGVNHGNTISVTEISGKPEARNTFDNPHRIVPRQKEITFSIGAPFVYAFPPNSISLLRIPIE